MSGNELRKESREALLHLLRNPHGWSEDAIRDARLRAAKELERLWFVERQMKVVVSDLIPLVGLDI
jgi:hypothetical protein